MKDKKNIGQKPNEFPKTRPLSMDPLPEIPREGDFYRGLYQSALKEAMAAESKIRDLEYKLKRAESDLRDYRDYTKYRAMLGTLIRPGGREISPAMQDAENYNRKAWEIIQKIHALYDLLPQEHMEKLLATEKEAKRAFADYEQRAERLQNDKREHDYIMGGTVPF